MRLRIILLFVAIILGVVAVVAVISYISSIRASVEEEVEKVEVLVAAQNIPKETPVEMITEAEAVILEAIPRKYLADGVLISIESYEGYVTAAPINKGEQITSTKFVKPEQIGLAFMIPEDMVAISIPVNEVIGVSNLINVGDQVNVIATFKPTQDDTGEASPGVLEEEIADETGGTFFDVEAALEKEITRTLLWNVEVLYVGTRIIVVEDEGQEDGILSGQTKKDVSTSEVRTVTLALNPEDSEKMIFTEEMGSVWLALLPVDGIERVDTPGRTMDNIFEE